MIPSMSYSPLRTHFSRKRQETTKRLRKSLKSQNLHPNLNLLERAKAQVHLSCRPEAMCCLIRKQEAKMAQEDHPSKNRHRKDFPSQRQDHVLHQKLQKPKKKRTRISRFQYFFWTFIQRRYLDRFNPWSRPRIWKSDSDCRWRKERSFEGNLRLGNRKRKQRSNNYKEKETW